MSTRYHDWIAHHASRRPEAIAAVDLARGRRLSYRAFDRRIAALAGHLRYEYNVVPGARVAWLAHNATDAFELQFACFRLGAIFVPLNWRLALPELHAIVADCTPTVIVHDEEFAGAADELVRHHAVEHSLARAVDGGAYECAVADAHPLAASRPAAHDDVCTILYTSGTTGVAKGSVTTHGMNF